MYGAIIGDIVGSKYEFNNIKTKEFPLFSNDCDYTDDTIMTVAVAKAIMLSLNEQFKTSGKGRSFRDFLIETMQDFGRRFPHPKGAYGANFSMWLQQNNPAPYNSFGNGSAMRVSPCGLVALTLEEAVTLARVSASVSHNHPEGIKGAEAVASAVFMAKTGKTKDEIRKYIEDNYYALDFTLDSIRETYSFDGSCQGSVPQAIVAFLESDNFEDAIRNVVSIGGDTDTTAAITGSIAWTYYIIQSENYINWVEDILDGSMKNIKEQSKKYLPEEFIKIADEFHELCWRRAGTYERVGICTPVITQEEKTFLEKERSIQEKISKEEPALDTELEKKIESFCHKYIVLMELLYTEPELNRWCSNYSSYQKNITYTELERIIYDGFMKQAYELNFMPEILSLKSYDSYSEEKALAGNKLDIAYGICMEIRSDYASNGSLIYSAIAKGKLYRLMKAFLNM